MGIRQLLLRCGFLTSEIIGSYLGNVRAQAFRVLRIVDPHMTSHKPALNRLLPPAASTWGDKFQRVVLGLSVLAAATTLSGCPFGDKGKSEDTAQVAAVVNDSEISIHQVKAYMARNPALATLGDAASGKALDALIEQELAAQSARRQSLDKSPAVIQAMELARREVLARAYQDELGNKANQPDSEAILKYYDEHPELFANRKAYTLAQTVVKADASVLSPVKDKVERTASFDALKQMLDGAALQASSQTVMQWSEDIPMTILPKLAYLKDGQSLVLQQEGALVILTVMKTEARPLSRNAASAAIRNLLYGNARRTQIESAMVEVRGKAQIVRKGAFAQDAAAATSGASSPLTSTQ
jgi:EpsD family peptidyl-prolyl cis-trans isomerase